MKLNKKQCEALEELGEVIERVQNVCGSLQIPITDELHVKALKESLPEISEQLKKQYESVMNEKIWN